QLPPQLPAESAQLVLLGRGEYPQLGRDVGRVPGEDAGNQPTARVGQVDRDAAAVVGVSLAAGQAALLQVVHDHRDVAAAAEQLPTQVALVHRAQVVKG